MSILATIVEQKLKEVSGLPHLTGGGEQLRTAMEARGDRRDFAAALRKPRCGDVALIAEVKKASPSAGVIRPDFDPVRIAQTYETGGASCLSVLTDREFFQGSLEYLKQIRGAVGLPLLRKDFIIDERQILEAIEWGADAILLIVAILTDDQLRLFQALARTAGLAALVEVHDEAEMKRALDCGAELVGVNNRDLKTFKMDLATTGRLADRIRESEGATGRGNRVLVAESGIHTRADVVQLKQAGAHAILVGESLMRQPDMTAKMEELLGTTSEAGS